MADDEEPGLPLVAGDHRAEEDGASCSSAAGSCAGVEESPPPPPPLAGTGGIGDSGEAPEACDVVPTRDDSEQQQQQQQEGEGQQGEPVDGGDSPSDEALVVEALPPSGDIPPASAGDGPVETSKDGLVHNPDSVGEAASVRESRPATPAEPEPDPDPPAQAPEPPTGEHSVDDGVEGE